MIKYLELFETELKQILSYWTTNVISLEKNIIYPECNIQGIPNQKASLGSLYLSRIIYGASATCQFFNTNEYKPLADLSYKILCEQFRNPAGGFYWARNEKGVIEHDSENTNMAQAFILYGLAEYAKLTESPIIELELKKHILFIKETLKDKTNGGYFDGFTIDWKQDGKYNKSLATHVHLLEAFVNYYSYKPNEELTATIRSLIGIICDHFIDEEELLFLHRLTPEWNKLPNFNWAGHNAEIGWILCSAAETIGDTELQKRTSDISLKLANKVIEQALDKKHGGIYNELKNGEPSEKIKLWWPSAETAISMLNTYKDTKDKTFLNHAISLIDYIDNTLSDKINGEWYTMVSADGQVIEEEPKVHFWKSLYHNVRYCIEGHKRIKSLIEETEN